VQYGALGTWHLLRHALEAALGSARTQGEGGGQQKLQNMKEVRVTCDTTSCHRANNCCLGGNRHPNGKSVVMGLPNHPFFGGPMSISFFTKEKWPHVKCHSKKRGLRHERGALFDGGLSNGHIETQRKIVTLSELLSVLGPFGAARQARVLVGAKRMLHRLRRRADKSQDQHIVNSPHHNFCKRVMSDSSAPASAPALPSGSHPLESSWTIWFDKKVHSPVSPSF
jgi:hypothetical protein